MSNQFNKFAAIDIIEGNPTKTATFDGHAKPSLSTGCKHMMISVDNFFRIFEIIIFCFVFAICDLVHDVEIIFHLSYVLTASGNIF